MTRAIIVLAKDLPDWWPTIARPRLQAYADTCHAEFVEVVPEKWEGMKTREITAKYVMSSDRSLVVDADVVVSRDAPDIFVEHHAGAVWMASDSEPGDPRAYRQQQLIIAAQAMHGSCGWMDGYGNSGVILCDREHNVLWRDWHDFPPHFCPDQININLKLRKSGRAHAVLGREWNSFGLNTPFKEGERGDCLEFLGYNNLLRVPAICHGAHIVHLAGFPEPDRTRAIQIADDILP